jgi:hypothetical protein
LDRPIAAGGTGASTAADARTNLVVAEKQASVNDGTAGRGLIVGAGGLLGNAPVSTDWNAETLTKFLRTGAASTNGAPSTSDIWTGLHISRGATAATQLGWSPSTADMRVRFKTDDTWGSWYRGWHAGNLVSTVSQTGGIPTGGVVQTGVTSSVYWERMAGGKQTVWAPGVNLTFESASRLQGSVSLPMAFIDRNYCVSGTLRPLDGADDESAADDGAVPGIGTLLPVVVGNKETTSLTVSVYRVSGQSNFVDGDRLYVDLTITGRWHA